MCMVAVGAPGEMVLHYRKVNLAAGEDQFLTPGTTIGPVVNLKTDNGTFAIGALICFDVFYPEAARLLALQVPPQPLC
jgi:predicted amidohydrolase